MTEDEVIKGFTYLISGKSNQYPPDYDLHIQVAIKALEELKQYRSIGTVEECREAAERQKEKKPIMKPYFEDMEEEYLCCPTCGDILTDRIPSKNEDFYFHCLNCGQKFSWEESEGEDE